jgi:cytosine/adenosine deaminase-related metal-dependent hydrolase
LILSHATVITVDTARRVIRDGAVAVVGGRIAAVGKSAEVERAFPHLPVRDCSGEVVIPGLVDTHVHLAQALLRGCADDRALIEWLTERVWVLQGNFTPEDGRASAALCIAEMLRGGTTTFLECLLAQRYGFDGIAEVVAQSGIRACLAGITMDTATYATRSNAMYLGMVEPGDGGFTAVLEAFDRWHGAAEGRVQVWFGPRTPGGCSPALFRRVGEAARERDTGITVHLAEVRDDIRFLREEYGCTPGAFAAECDILGLKTVLAHGVWIPPEDFPLLAESGATVAHCPNSNSKLASGIAPAPEMLTAGVNVALGCDGGPSNNTYDLLREMRAAAVVHKARTLDPLLLPGETVLEMATINGARALGLQDEIGSIEAGKKADLVVVDFRTPHLVPAPNPVSALVYGASAADVDAVLVDGRLLVDRGRVLTLDERAVACEATERAEALYARTGLTAELRWPVL